MNKIYQEALNGTLKSIKGEPYKGNGEVIFTNNTEIPLLNNIIWYDGLHIKGIVLKPKEAAKWSPCYLGNAFLFSSAQTGAFASAIVLTDINVVTYSIHCELLAEPNDIGVYPKPTSDSPIPTDSPRVLVSCGLLPNGNPITREQFWSREADSYMLAAGEKRVVSFTESSGMEQTTSDQTTVAASVGVSASAGWGPISASVSSSLSKTSTTFQQVTVKTQQTRYESVELENKTDASRLFLKWALTDVITVFDKSNSTTALSSIIMRERPILIGGPYNPGALTSVTRPIVDPNLPRPQVVVSG